MLARKYAINVTRNQARKYERNVPKDYAKSMQVNQQGTRQEII